MINPDSSGRPSSSSPVNTTQSSTPGRKKIVRVPPPAGFWFREAAYFWDILVFHIPFMMLGTIMGLGQMPMGLDETTSYFIKLMWILVLEFAIWSVYHIECEYRLGTTIGKYWLGLRVENTDGTPLDRKSSAVRYLSAGISWITLNIGHGIALARPDKAMLHDLISSTHVVASDDVSFGRLHPVSARTATIMCWVSWGLQVLFFATLCLMIFKAVSKLIPQL